MFALFFRKEKCHTTKNLKLLVCFYCNKAKEFMVKITGLIQYFFISMRKDRLVENNEQNITKTLEYSINMDYLLHI